MNEAAAISPRVWIGAHRLLFCGPLPSLERHRHPFHCVLLTTGRPFEVEAAGGPVRCRLVLVPGGHDHALRFEGQPMTTLYIPPHDADFAALARPRAAGIGPAPWRDGWSRALEAWHGGRDPEPLRRVVRETWAAERPALDRRVRRMARRFATGDGLDHPPAALAAEVGLSASRLRHLVKDHTGSSIGEVQRGYRFVHAARSMLEAARFTRAAHAAGFADSAHFSRSFRAAYGVAPSRILFAGTRWRLHDTL